MKRQWLIFCLAMVLVHCGGTAGSLGQTPLEVLLDFDDPQASFSISADDFSYQLAVYSESSQGESLVFGPADLSSYNADQNVYSVRADDLILGHYIGELRLVKAGLGKDGSALPLSGAHFDLDLSDRKSQISLSNLEWDESPYDDDLDGLSNMAELAAGSDPYNEDTDGDGVPDGVDAFPVNPSESYDFDGDGFGDAQDADIDSDGLSNLDESKLGTDPIQPDTDFDTVLDGEDNCPLAANFGQEDFDEDGLGDECDSDRDGDGLSDAEEIKKGSSPLLADTDGDGVGDADDQFPKDKTENKDNDGDGIGDNVDTDDDNDGLLDDFEITKGLNPNKADTDADGIRDEIDNCGLVVNAGQADNDNDGLGDDCDDDDDNDSLSDAEEARIGSDGFITNAKLADSDGDGFLDSQDNCPNHGNITQTDADTDGFGAACDCDDADVNVNQLALDTPDSQKRDLNCDGIDGDRYNSIFVATTGTQPANATIYGATTSDLQGALEEGVSTGKPILIAAGDYNVDGIEIPEGVSAYGGYSENFLNRDTLGQAQITRFISPVHDMNGAALSLVGLEQRVLFSGITFLDNSEAATQILVLVSDSKVDFENCVFLGNEESLSENLLVLNASESLLQGNQFYGRAIGESSGLYAANSNLKLTNSLFAMGDANHTRGIDFDTVTGVVANNTIDGGRHTTGTAYAALFTGSTLNFTNNAFITENDRNQAGLVCLGFAEESTVDLKNNAFLRFTSRGLTYPAYIQCDGTPLYNAGSMDSSEELNSSNNLVNATESVSQLTQYVLPDSFYEPALGSILVNSGRNTQSDNEGTVLFDLLGNERIQNAYDIGANEL